MSIQALEASTAKTSSMMFSVGDIALGLAPKMSFAKDPSGNDVLSVDDVAVFRTGSFEDSMGRRNLWERTHLDSMVSNFAMLKDRNIFADVPIRSGHPGWLIVGTEGNGKVVGYHKSLRVETRQSTHDGNSYDYLIASYDIIDPEAQQAIKSGLWRNRSAEVATYVTNDGAEYFPVYFGVAYVDIPAVEGLNGFSKNNHNTRIIEEERMSADQQVVIPVAPKLPTALAAPPAPEVLAHAAPASAAAAPEPVVNAQPVANYALAGETLLFTIEGNKVQDYMAVQRHIEVLESFRSETIEGVREDFVKRLANDGKILASHLEATVAFAKGLNAEQFTAWQATQEVAPVNPILGKIDQFSAPTGGDALAVPKDDQITILAGTVRQHKRAGKSDDMIKGTASYKKLMSLDPEFTL